MGICKCKRRTDLYCYVHNKPVCDNCVVDHGQCHIRTYPEWLASSEYPPPSCAKCHQSVSAGEQVIRLKCLELFHPHCIDAHLQTIGVDRVSTAGCPSCNVTLLPAASDTSALAESIRAKLESLPCAPVIPRTPKDTGTSMNAPAVASFSTPAGTSKASRIRDVSVVSSSSVPSTPASNSMPLVSSDGAPFPGRKHNPKGSARSVEIQIDDADDNKYGRKTILDRLGIRPFLKRLALMQQTPGFNRKAILVLVIAGVIVLIYLIISALSAEEETVQIQ